MTNTWTQNYTAPVITSPVTYSVQRRAGSEWVEVWQTTDYLQALAWIVRHRRTNPKTDKVRISLTPKIQYR